MLCYIFIAASSRSVNVDVTVAMCLLTYLMAAVIDSAL